MGQVSPFLRRTTRGFSHWCPGCGEMHCIFDSWEFDKNVNCPTFKPSVAISGKQKILDAQGKWIGDWHRNPDGTAKEYRCHYFLTAGLLNFQADCTHHLKGQTVPLPLLPAWLLDPISS